MEGRLSQINKKEEAAPRKRSGDKKMLDLSPEEAVENAVEDAAEHAVEDAAEDAAVDAAEHAVEDAAENAREKEILEIVDNIKSNEIEEIKEKLSRIRRPFGIREKKLLENILVFISFAADSEEEVVLEWETVKVILEEVAPLINIRRLIALTQWEMHPDTEEIKGVVSSKNLLPRRISEQLLVSFIEKELIPMSKLMMYTALCIDSTKEECLGGMFNSLISCTLSLMQ